MRTSPAARAALFVVLLQLLAAAEAPARGISHAEELRMQANWLRHRGPDGLFPATKEYDYLRLRYAIDPPRFDHYHLKLGPALGQDIRLRVGMEHLGVPLNGLLPETPSINYLRWQRSLNPARFDRSHPQLGRLLGTDQTIRASLPPAPVVLPASYPPPTAPQVVLPPPTLSILPPTSLTTTPPSTTGGGPNPPPGGTSTGNPPSTPPITKAVPEPASLVLLALGSAFAIRRRLAARRAHSS